MQQISQLSQNPFLPRNIAAMLQQQAATQLSNTMSMLQPTSPADEVLFMILDIMKSVAFSCSAAWPPGGGGSFKNAQLSNTTSM